MNAPDVPDTTDVDVSTQDAAQHTARCAPCARLLHEARTKRDALTLHAWKRQMASYLRDGR
jgi:hypothetical protein